MLNNKYKQFAALHSKEQPLILYNCWNVSTARSLEESNQQAIATSSYSMADSLGYQDGENIPFDLLLLLTKNISRNVDLPLTVDIETGYGENYLNNILSIVKAGAVGINLEDQIIGSKNYELADIKQQADKIKNIIQFCRSHEYEIFINARTDIFFKNSNHTIETCKLALERAYAYSAAGAQCIFIPGINDLNLIEYFVDNSPLPVNVMLTNQSPSLDILSKLGVSRISYGPTSYFQANNDFSKRIDR